MNDKIYHLSSSFIIHHPSAFVGQVDADLYEGLEKAGFLHDCPRPLGALKRPVAVFQKERQNVRLCGRDGR